MGAVVWCGDDTAEAALPDSPNPKLAVAPTILHSIPPKIQPPSPPPPPHPPPPCVQLSSDEERKQLFEEYVAKLQVGNCYERWADLFRIHQTY